MRYRGFRTVVPASWPVYNLKLHPTVCVRFDRHAVYLGQPSPAQRCPAHAAGRTEAMLVEPLGARAASGPATVGAALPPVTNLNAQPPHGSSTRLVEAAAGVVVMATWGNHPSVVSRALGSRTLKAGQGGGVQGAGGPAVRARAAGAAAGAVYTGLGFDACSAPSAARMRAWSASPYRAVGVYIGGANMACAQPNLTASWLSAQSSAGWRFIPTYVGLQAPHNACGCAAIHPSQASLEGAAAASDAVTQAGAVGIGPGNPVYFDMEGYARGGTNSAAVLAFLSAWTAKLHAAGYLSGVYSSAGAGISDLVAARGSGVLEPDDVWIADWNGQRSASSSYVPAGEWSNHHRLHQYEGGHDETYRGVRLNIDSNYLDGATAGVSAAGAAAAIPDGTFVQVEGSQTIYEIAGGAPLFASSEYWSALGAQTPTPISAQQFASLNPVPADGTFLALPTGASYRVAGGAPLVISNPSLFTGVRPVTIDPWDIANITAPEVHLNEVPLDGTLVEGLPSRTYWVFAGDRRRLGPASPFAVQVDDAGLAAFPTIPCVVPRLQRLTLPQVRRALRQADCRLGKVGLRGVARRARVLHVVKQTAAPRTKHAARYAVGVTLG